MKSENLYWIWLAEILGAGSQNLIPLIEKFETPYEIYRATEEELERSNCVNEHISGLLSNKNLDRAYRIIDFCVANNIGIMTYADEYYPSRLKNLKNPPAVLYYKGAFPDVENRVCIAMVGTRKMSEYGKRAAFRLSHNLASANVVVVSGMALGIDSICACGAITAGGTTIAVLGCGIDIVYPIQHAKLKKIIESKGAVISEFAPGTKPVGTNFPIRNRIISGLCNGTLIVEADAKSGAMITAKSALLQGREIYAVPGNIDENNAQGTNQLIHDGAYPVLSADDVLINYSLTYANSLNYSGLAYAKSTYRYDEQAIENMGISARAYEKNNSFIASEKKNDNKLKSSELRPTKKPPENNEKSKRSTIDESFEPNSKYMSEKAKAQSDKSLEILENLDEKSKKIFSEIPIDRAISIDKLCSLGFNISDVMAALTVLEVNGLISTLPGNIYIRR